jgi:hypothetical protein
MLESLSETVITFHLSGVSSNTDGGFKSQKSQLTTSAISSGQAGGKNEFQTI